MSSPEVWRKEFHIPSTTEAGKTVIDQLLAQLEAYNWPKTNNPAYFGVHLAMEEALVNAIKHGNQLDPQKTVHITLEVSTQHTRITIQDEGDGFNLEDVPDPTDKENLEKTSGRGLALMYSFMTSVTFNDTGNEVTMLKELAEELALP